MTAHTLFILPLTITENVIFFATLRLCVENLTQSRQDAKVFWIHANFGAKPGDCHVMTTHSVHPTSDDYKK